MTLNELSFEPGLARRKSAVREVEERRYWLKFWVKITAIIALIVITGLMYLATPTVQAKQTEAPAFTFSPKIVDPSGAMSEMSEFCSGYRADKKELNEKPSPEVINVCKKYHF